MDIKTMQHNGETYFIIKETIDTRIYLADDNKSVLVLDRYDNILAEVTCFSHNNESILELKNL